MAGFGNTLARAVIGGLGGVGDYLTTRGKIEEETKQQEAQSQRAMALEQFRASIQADRDATLNAYQRGNIVLTGTVNRSNNIAEVGAKAAADAAGDARDFELWKKKNAITFSTWRAQQGIELSNDKAKTLYAEETKARFAAEQNGMEKVSDDVANDTGTRVITFKDKKTGEISTYDTGVVVQQKEQTDPFGLKTTPTKPSVKPTVGWRGGGGGSTDAGSTGAGGGGRSKVDIGIDQLLTTYATATPDRYPGLFRNGKKIPIDEAKAMVRRQYGG